MAIIWPRISLRVLPVLHLVIVPASSLCLCQLPRLHQQTREFFPGGSCVLLQRPLPPMTASPFLLFLPSGILELPGAPDSSFLCSRPGVSRFSRESRSVRRRMALKHHDPLPSVLCHCSVPAFRPSRGTEWKTCAHTLMHADARAHPHLWR